MDSLSGTARNYTLFNSKQATKDGCKVDAMSKNTCIHTTMRRCPKCGYRMQINTISKKEWCENCE